MRGRSLGRAFARGRSPSLIRWFVRLPSGGCTSPLASSLFGNLAEHIDRDTINQPVDRCPSKVQWSEGSVGASGLLQPLLGEAAEPRQPQLEKRLEALYLVRVDAVVEAYLSSWVTDR